MALFYCVRTIVFELRCWDVLLGRLSVRFWMPSRLLKYHYKYNRDTCKDFMLFYFHSCQKYLEFLRELGLPLRGPSPHSVPKKSLKILWGQRPNPRSLYRSAEIVPPPKMCISQQTAQLAGATALTLVLQR